MREFLSWYSNNFDHVNEDLVLGVRKTDNMVEKIEELCIEIAKNLHENVTYLGAEYDDSKNRFRELNQGSSSKKKDSKTGKFENVQYINVNYTYSRLAVFNFRIKYVDPRTNEVDIRKISMPIYIPQIFDGYHYLIRGNKYSAPFQLIDAITYKGKNDSIVLKTLTRAIKLSREPTIVKDAHGLEYSTYAFYTHVSNKKIPFLMYYFAFYGFFSTLKFFGVDTRVRIYEDCPLDPDEDVIYFHFGKLYLGVDRDEFNGVYELKQIVATILTMGRKYLSLDQIRDTFYWRMKLGEYINATVKTYDQGAALLTTFYTCVDARTIKNIENIVGGSPKTNAFTILRWMFLNYSNLSNKNNSLRNKRIRYTEYLITPLVREVQTRLYRYIKTRVNMRDEKRLLDIFRVSPSILCYSIIGKVKNKSQSLGIAKFSSEVNDLVLLGSALKFDRGGPGSAIERLGKRAGVKFRTLSPDVSGYIDVNSTPNGNPGVAGNLTPFADINPKDLTFNLK